MSDLEKTTAPGYLLDKQTNALVRPDTGPYEAIKAARANKRAQNNLVSDVAALKEQINTLRADVDILMGLFKEVLRREP